MAAAWSESETAAGGARSAERPLPLPKLLRPGADDRAGLGRMKSEEVAEEPAEPAVVVDNVEFGLGLMKSEDPVAAADIAGFGRTNNEDLGASADGAADGGALVFLVSLARTESATAAASSSSSSCWRFIVKSRSARSQQQSRSSRDLMTDLGRSKAHDVVCAVVILK